MGMALTPCTVPHSGEPSFTLAEDEMEIGVGIHGEPGRERVKLAPADEIVATAAGLGGRGPAVRRRRQHPAVRQRHGRDTRRSSCTWPTIRPGSSWRERGIEVTRSLVGNYITSLEMQGMSITLLKLDDEFTELWDAPVHTAALRWGV